MAGGRSYQRIIAPGFRTWSVSILVLFVVPHQVSSQCASTFTTAQVCPQLIPTSPGVVTTFTYVDPSNWTIPYILDTPQQQPCISSQKTCRLSASNIYSCSSGMQTLASFPQNNQYNEIFPGSPAVCGHGNREYSFLARRGTSRTNVIVAFLTGGMCWDAESCGADAARRTMAVDSSPTESAPAVSEMFKIALAQASTVFKGGIYDFSRTQNPFSAWSVVLVPDCTGDQFVGNRSYTYAPDDPNRCITVHHRGAANAGLAMQWVADNFGAATDVLILGTGTGASSKATGGHGGAFWAPYLQQRIPSANVRVVVDSSLGLLGPGWAAAMSNDTWGAADGLVPEGVAAAAAGKPLSSGHYLLPRPEEWSLALDDLSSYYELVAEKMPKIAFADVALVNEPLQQELFVLTGGMLADCCLDGCSCNFGVSTPPAAVLPYGVRAGAAPFGVRGGQLDWTKTLKVTVLRRLMRMPNNYRAWLIDATPGRARFLLSESSLFGTANALGAASPLCPSGGTRCVPANFFVATLVGGAAGQASAGAVLFNLDGSVAGSTLSGASTAASYNSYAEIAFGSTICAGCLGGIPGSLTNDPTVNDFCNATLGDAETLFSVAPAYGHPSPA